MSPTFSGKGKESGTARVLGSGTSGVAELLIFHPVDTIAKRLMSNKAKVSTQGLSAIIFREQAAAPLGRKILSLFPGLGYAAGYKVSQRIYKFGGQPWFNDIITRHYKSSFTNTFGERKGKMMMQATAGSLTGIGEVVLLPLDALKIKRQVNPEAFRGRGALRIFREEGTTLYRGWGWTMARNAPGSFALFGASAVTKDYVLGISDYSKATWAQNFVASIAGAVASITVAAPLDTIKTRIQNANFEHKTSGVTVIKDLLREEGATALFKGLTPKILVVGPKLVFSYTIAQSLIPWFANYV
ncbi:mitochondrial carrier [Artomyces pyxidatus]|uniref:Mitochondrial carrier n=1 Tax=Artomyces pyxidatus TaxID=48021 RepID=A0ACB8SKG1_9AGAM|nr:mitochondrial carrier [Artomyces pyxidatus]